jgi:TRAP-type mannitol/chloroaromatic compound transport system permease large subunit
MSPGEVALILLGGFFLLLALRVPVAFALGIASLPPLFIDPRVSLSVLFDTMYASFNSFLLLAVPFFLLAANLMNAGGITARMLRLARALVGHLPGSLGQINVVLSVLFAGVSGSSTADAASQSKIFIPAMTKEGYDLSFAVANTAVSSVLAVVIPPSILMIIWGGTMSTSIGALFVGGLLPGLGLTIAMMITVHVYAKVRHYPTYERALLARARRRARGGWPRAHDAAHHHRRQDLRLVHRHRGRGRRGALFHGAGAPRLPRDRPQEPLRHARRHGPVLGRVALRARHRLRLRLAPRLLQGAQCAARDGELLGHGPHRDRLLRRRRVPHRRLLPRRDSPRSSSSAPCSSRSRFRPAWIRSISP